MSDHSFLILFAIVAVAAGVGAQLWRTIAAGTERGQLEPAETLTGTETAMISGGAESAVRVSRAQLVSLGRLTADGERRALGSADDCPDEVSRAVLLAIGRLEPEADASLVGGVAEFERTPIADSDLLDDAEVAAALEQLRRSLVRKQLLVSRRRQRRIALSITPLVLLELFASVRAVSVLADGRSIVLLLVCMAVLAAIVIGVLLTIPERTTRGELSLARIG